MLSLSGIIPTPMMLRASSVEATMSGREQERDQAAIFRCDTARIHAMRCDVAMVQMI